MPCIRPIKASIAFDGTITFSQKKAIPGLIGFDLPCRKCLSCRLSNAREKAIRAYHEAQMHEDNIFLTLTYDDDHLESPRLIKSHIQDFIKDLRNHLGNDPEKRISTMYTGEYGELNKRPHWHVLVFNYRPIDCQHKYTTDRGDEVYTSKHLGDLWSKGAIEFGDVTMDSASYVARYAAKKLVHGKDQDHDFHPIHRTSSKNAIGKRWIEKYWEQTFGHGYVILPNGQKAGIPRYYEDWLKKHHPDAHFHYVTEVKIKTQKLAEESARKEELIYLSNFLNYKGGAKAPLSRQKVKLTILESKFKTLQENLKL